MVTKDNVITYAYKGLAALVYLIFGKKEKIKELYFEEDVIADNFKTTSGRLEKANVKENFTCCRSGYFCCIGLRTALAVGERRSGHRMGGKPGEHPSQ